MKKIFKWFFRKLQEWEGIWLLPLLFCVVLWLSSFLISLWGPTAGIFPPGYMNAIVQAALIYFSGMTVVNFTMVMYHRGWYKYYYGKRQEDSAGLPKHHSRLDINHTPPWLRLIFVPVMQLLFLLLYFFLVARFI